MKRHLFSSLSALLFAGAVVSSSHSVSYEGYQVLRWNHDVDSHIDIVVAPDQILKLESLKLDYRTLHKNLGESITAESKVKDSYRRDVDDLSWYDSYHSYADHVQYLSDLHEAFLDNSELISSGRSHENRSIHGIHLYGDDGPGKPAVLYHGTVHAREWITAPVVEYLTLQLITAHKTNATKSILNQYDFHIFPIVNPDDINRNWEYGWDVNSLGASTNACAQTYRGQKPSDTIENQGLDSYVRKLRDSVGIKLYIDWHSYGQYILSPFGSKEEWYAPELGKWTKTASLLSETIRDSSDRRTTFTFGPSGATLYTTTGAAPDHVYAIGGAGFSYTIELPDTGDSGFVLPPELIRGAAEEQWAGQQVLYTLLDEVFFDGRGPA
ncbi:hypothetical protein J7T55_008105 [Diaporthe amygdali]|uniref:uncharacterized protein n=1 Tax=Phomopsis amygdali TaxID=1214568 RepID=UPI0022FEE301|nr:uncharacterized protein J7T55_008105 [Diaporthe amygdali]KAJ0107969.1 hypothetical protein J7T55_008105 [Diaporthe amygdali]